MSVFGLFRNTFAEEAARAANTPGARVVDVRTPEEYAAGHLPNAENIPLDALAGAAFPAGETLFVYCWAASRATAANSNNYGFCGTGVLCAPFRA